MPAARGDRKPCTVAACPGTMQYGRRRDQKGHVRPLSRPEMESAAQDAKGWVCSDAPEHFVQQE